MTSHNPEVRYSAEQIATFLLEEEVAIHGLSSAVLSQNQALIREVRQVSSTIPGLLSVSVMGSRAQGTSELGSDVDLCAFQMEGAHAEEKIERAAGSLMRSCELDFFGATSVHDIARVVPTDPKEFVEMIEDWDKDLIAFFHEGVYDTPARRLLGLAALKVWIANTGSTSHGRWELVRDNYNKAFLGDINRMFDKLQERLRVPTAQLAQDINLDLILARYEKFGLPATPEELYEKELAWFNVNQKELKQHPLYKFYRRVVAYAK